MIELRTLGFVLLQRYILTLMQTVSRIYRSGSLGNRVLVSVVKLVILKESETFAPPYDSGQFHISASEMLKTFCKWQSRIKRQPDANINFDVALLLTRCVDLHQTLVYYLFIFLLIEVNQSASCLHTVGSTN